METTTARAALSTGEMLMISSARRNLRRVIYHPAFTRERRQKAEELISTSTDAARLMKWKALALIECEAWEDAKLQQEHEQPGPPAHPEYQY